MHEAEYAINSSKSGSTGHTLSRLLFGIDQRGFSGDEIKEYLNAQVNCKPRSLEKIKNKAAEKTTACQKYNENIEIKSIKNLLDIRKESMSCYGILIVQQACRKN